MVVVVLIALLSARCEMLRPDYLTAAREGSSG